MRNRALFQKFDDFLMNLKFLYIISSVLDIASFCNFLSVALYNIKIL